MLGFGVEFPGLLVLVLIVCDFNFRLLCEYCVFWCILGFVCFLVVGGVGFPGL